ncbi:MAG: DUF333 domain-containing protein [bacterium]
MKTTLHQRTLLYYGVAMIMVCLLASPGKAQFNTLNPLNQEFTLQKSAWDFFSYTPLTSLSSVTSGRSNIFNTFNLYNSFPFSSSPFTSTIWAPSSGFFATSNLWNWSRPYGTSSIFGAPSYNSWNYGWGTGFLGGSLFQPPVNTGIANPAAVYCINNGGEHKIKTDEQGNQYGICVFNDGSECDEWEYYRGECSPGDNPPGTELPPWLIQLIETLKKEPVANPPAKIIQYTYNDETVYFVPQKCCDIPSILYDSQGTVICSPDGGFTGRGDGRCPDFFSKRKNQLIIWEDERNYPPSADQSPPSQGSLDPQPGDEHFLKGSVYLEQTDVLLLESFPVQVKLLIKGALPTPCNQLRATVSKPDNLNRINVSLYSVVDPEIFCIQVLQSFEERLSLGSYRQGTFSVWINDEHVEDFSL